MACNPAFLGDRGFYSPRVTRGRRQRFAAATIYFLLLCSDAYALTAPSLISPSDGATVCADVSTLFTWSSVSGATGYELQFGTETPISTTLTSFSLVTGTTGPNTWKVRAKNSCGTGPWSSQRSFTVVAPPSVSPSLSSPSNGATVCADVSTLFTWSSVSGATGYDLQFGSETPISTCPFGKPERNLNLSGGVGPLKHIPVIPRHPAVGF